MLTNLSSLTTPIGERSSGTQLTNIDNKLDQHHNKRRNIRRCNTINERGSISNGKDNLNENFVFNKDVHEIGRQGRTRYHIALLGLAIAVVNCYAQATFCIAIVEMVLPADYIFKDEVGKSVVKVVIPTSTVSPLGSTAQTSDNSCPIEYQYRDYYDSWRFPPISTTNTVASNNSNVSSSLSAIPIIQATTTINDGIDIRNRFNWDASQQGLLLGAFAIGTAPLQVLGGRLAEIYGAKWVLLAGCIGTAITNLTIPLLAHFSFILLIVNRVVMGITQAGMEPGLMCLLAEWLTPAETSFFISMLLFAICIGFFLGSLFSSFLLTLGYGWPLAYYVAGGMNLLVGIVWLVYASSRPRGSGLISIEELEYIEHEQKSANNNTQSKQEFNRQNDDLTSGIISTSAENDWTKRNISIYVNDNQTTNCKYSTTVIDEKLGAPPAPDDDEQPSKSGSSEGGVGKSTGGQAPWMNILSTPSVWAFIICKISIRWCADVLAIELPTYLANVLHLSIKLNGILNSVSSALFAIFSFLTGYLVNEILKTQNSEEEQKLTTIANGCVGSSNRRLARISKTNLRKLFQSVASFGSAITVFLMTRYDCNILFSMSMLLILSCCLVMGTGGELQIPYDMTSRYPGTLHGMACTLSVSGWLAPPLIGLILGDQPSSRHRWSIVWYLTAAINLVGGLVFVLFADASPRDFDQKSASPTAVAAAGCCFGWVSKHKKREQDERGHSDVAVARQEEDSPDSYGDSKRRTLTGYYNIACSKSPNASPTSSIRGHPEPPESSGNRLEPELSRHHNDNGSRSQWSYFDHEPIRIRQVEDSFIRPSYLLNFESIAAHTTIFPYHMTKQQLSMDSLKPRMMASASCDQTNVAANKPADQSQPSVLGRLWSLLGWTTRRRKRKFSMDSLVIPPPDSKSSTKSKHRHQLADVLPNCRRQNESRPQTAQTNPGVGIPDNQQLASSTNMITTIATSKTITHL